MLSRRGFFGMLAGVAASLVMPGKAKAAAPSNRWMSVDYGVGPGKAVWMLYATVRGRSVCIADSLSPEDALSAVGFIPDSQAVRREPNGFVILQEMDIAEARRRWPYHSQL